MSGNCAFLESIQFNSIFNHFSAYYLKFIIKRSRLCLDFALTCHTVHLIAVTIYNKKFPLNFIWWTLSIFSTWLMTERSRSLCLCQELLPISLKRPEMVDASDEISYWTWTRFKSGINKLLKSRRKTSNSSVNSALNLTTSKTPLFHENKK